MKESQQERLVRLLAEVRTNYPETKGSKIHIEWARLDDAWGTFRIKQQVNILIDAGLKKASDSAVKGMIAHEISHLVEISYIIKSKGSLGLMAWGIKKKMSQRQKNLVERNTDISVISHGLGKCLLEFMEFDDARGEDEDGEIHEGLTTLEVKKYISIQEEKNSK